jgi:hypothetical protein
VTLPISGNPAGPTAENHTSPPGPLTMPPASEPDGTGYLVTVPDAVMLPTLATSLPPLSQQVVAVNHTFPSGPTASPSAPATGYTFVTTPDVVIRPTPPAHVDAVSGIVIKDVMQTTCSPRAKWLRAMLIAHPTCIQVRQYRSAALLDCAYAIGAYLRCHAQRRILRDNQSRS